MVFYTVLQYAVAFYSLLFKKSYSMLQHIPNPAEAQGHHPSGGAEGHESGSGWEGDAQGEAWASGVWGSFWGFWVYGLGFGVLGFRV